MKYTDNKHLVDYISSHDLINFKEELLNTIFFVKGNREELYRAINDAENAGFFTFDVHEDIKLSSEIPLKDEYTEEIINMSLNYSRERFEKLLRLYNRCYKEGVFSSKESSIDLANKSVDILNSNNRVESDIKNDNIMKIVKTGVVLAIAAYALYKIFD